MLKYMETLKNILVNMLGPVWMEGGRREVEGSRVELAENRLILGQIYSTLFYSPFLPLNPNGPLKNQGTMREKKWRAVVLIWQKTMVLISSKTILMKEVE